jgi:hypothetical protein
MESAVAAVFVPAHDTDGPQARIGIMGITWPLAAAWSMGIRCGPRCWNQSLADMLAARHEKRSGQKPPPRRNHRAGGQESRRSASAALAGQLPPRRTSAAESRGGPAGPAMIRFSRLAAPTSPAPSYEPPGRVGPTAPIRAGFPGATWYAAHTGRRITGRLRPYFVRPYGWVSFRKTRTREWTHGRHARRFRRLRRSSAMVTGQVPEIVAV